MSTSLKNNVNQFNKDIKDNTGYKYTTNANLSSILANKRMTEESVRLLDESVHTVIDIGSGDGTYTSEIKNIKNKIRIVGFDPATDAVLSAKKQFPQLEFLSGNILEPSSFPNEKFDIGILRGVLHHLNDPKLAISNALKLTDKLIIIEPNGNNPVLKVIEKVSTYHRLHEERSFSSRQLKQWCKESGFEIKYFNYIGFIPMFFPKFLTKVIYFFQPFLEKFYLLKKYFGAQIVILCVRK